MRATNFEFRNRFWFISGIFVVSFWLYALDHQNLTNVLSASLARWDGLSAGANINLVVWLGAAAALVCIAVRVWATAYLRADVMRDPSVRSERVVADGPYRRVRNPLYLGNILLALAMAPLASRLGAVVLVVLMIAFSLRLIAREEAELKASQGENYLRFARAVPKLIPALMPRLPSSGARPRWKQAFIGESFTMAFALAVVVFAATKNQKFFWICIVAGFAIAGLTRFWLKPGSVESKQQSA
jgi:protein-S-isoprenylcysteine O-methyltransferase Ste14